MKLDYQPIPLDPEITATDEGITFKVDWLGVSSNLVQGLFNLLAERPAGFTKNLEAIIKGFQKVEGPGRLAFRLVHIALTKAVGQTLADLSKELPKEAGAGDSLTEAFTKDLDEGQVTLLAQHLEDPPSLPLLDTVMQRIKNWLDQWDLTEAKAEQTKKRIAFLPQHYLRAFSAEWMSQPQRYEPLKDAFQRNEFWESFAKQRYREHLWSMYYAPLMNEPDVALNDVYLDPGVRVYKECFQKEEDTRKYREHQEGDNVMITLPMEEITSLGYLKQLFFEGTAHCTLKAKDPFVLLLGYPGQGKSSFTKRLLDEVFTEESTNASVFWVKLRDIEDLNALAAKPITTLLEHLNDRRKSREILWEVQDTELDGGVLILDGLDEIFMSQGLREKQIDTFLDHLATKAKQFDGLRLLVTSRLGYANIHDHRKDYHVL
ncbi:MAG TPA: hypothetical protein DCE41_05470, partial [Cytophagales bacterium]|nr:hypothetical protein [Cytophagales bacterium]